MFVYDMGIIDFFDGMLTINDFMKLKDFHSHLSETYEKEFKKFLMQCFMEVKAKKTYWEGDIREGPYIGVIPRPTSALPYKFIAFKQDNNGHSFLVSEFPFNFDSSREDYEITNIHELNKLDNDKLFHNFNECYDLVESLFLKNIKTNVPEKKQSLEETIDKFDIKKFDNI